MNISDKVKELLEQESFAAAIGEAKTIDEVREIFAENGAELTSAEVSELQKAIYLDNCPNELSEAELTAVAGGGFLKDVWNGIKKGWKWGKKVAEWEQKIYNKYG